MPQTHLITLDPGHFHAALVQKEMYAGVAPQVHVYAPLGGDLLLHLNRIAGFNSRPEKPTAWELDVHAAPDFLERLLRERPGNVVVLAGRNGKKIDYIEAAVGAGLNVLVDKPWIIRSADLPRLEGALDQAERKGLVAYDIMTERHEITNILQRELVHDPETFGDPVTGSEQDPAVRMDSVHYLRKLVAGAPLRRPPWFFDVRQQGEGLSDVGVHLVDLVAWVLFPEQAIDHQREVQVLSGRRWPTELTREQFKEITVESDFPAYLAPAADQGRLAYYCNNFVSYVLRGQHVQLNAVWDYQAEVGGDTHLAVFRGSRSRVEIHQGCEQNFIPELYVVPEHGADKTGVRTALERKTASLQVRFPGLEVDDQGARLRVHIPSAFRVGHEAHFALVTRQFLQFLKNPRSLPAWEKPGMLAKYVVATRGVEAGQ